MTKVHSTSLKILILGMACFPYIIFPDHIDDEIIKYVALAKENKDKYTINEVPFSRNKDLINDVIKSTLKNYRKNSQTSHNFLIS